MKTLAGKICVDSGMVLIGDPAYLKRPEVAHGIEAAMTGRRRILGVEPAVGDNSDMSLGAIAKTAHGDGRYPVWIETDGAERVRRLTIEFVDE